MPIRLIALDIDGTLLDGRGRVSGDNSETIARAAAAGIEIVLVTGRRFDFARPISDSLPCDLHLIVNNGALIKSKDGATLLRHLLPTATARRVLDATEDYRAATAIVFDRPREAQVVMEHIDFADPLRGPYFRRNAEFLAEVNLLTNALDGTDPIQVMFSGGCREMRGARKQLQGTDFAQEFSTELTEYEARNFSILDVLQHDVSKGVALAEWARRRGIARDDVMAIGDNWNDRDMLEFAGLAVVMGNSVKELKSLGWPVTLSNDESGVAEAIRTYAFGEKSRARA
jgi:Cof subfamily protein (haloacid dehalogenase superfamily)